MKILLIEDNPDHALITKRVLDKTYHNYVLELVNNSNEGLKRIFENNYDLILSDFNLPGLTALDILKEMSSKGKDTPFIVSTSAGNEKTAVALMKEGAYDYILKDFSYEETLPVVINRSLERYNAKKEKEELEQKIIFQASLLNHVNNAVIAIDPDKKIAFCNRYTETLLQWKADEIVGRNIFELLTKEDIKDALKKIIDEVGHSGRWIGDCIVERKDGSPFPVFFTCSLIKDAQEKTIGLVCGLIDITERKKLEDSLRRGHDELELSVEERSMELAKANEQLRYEVLERKQTEEELKEAYNKLKQTQAQLVQTGKMAAVGQLASGVAHEINNPLTGILNNVQMIKMEVERGNNFNIEEFRDILNHVEESAVRCKKITRSLLDFSRASKETFQPVSLNEAVEKVVTLVGYEMKLENIIIQRQLQENLPSIMGDFQLIQQVVFNLISNGKWAIEKKSRKEGGTINIKTGHEPGNAIVNLEVSDTGIGIPQENMEKMFEPFFTTKPVGEGTGLGLALIYKIINDHKGAIGIESQVNQGTAFKISLPAVL